MSEMTYDTPEQGYDNIIEETLLQPIPNMDELRERKKGYNELPIDDTHQKFREPIVDIADFGIAGQGYYSRPNATTGEALPGAPSSLHLRKSVAETLAKINSTLQSPVFTELFGGEVELYVEDALRSVSLQTGLHDELVPALLRKNHPEMSNEEIAKRVKSIIAVPSADPKKPSPHATGGALDVILRYKQATPRYVEGSNVPMGHEDGETSARINPDYFEQNEPLTEEDKIAQRNRRAYYAIMTGAAFGVDTGLVNNPTEWWHWGSGDQLSAKVRGDDAAYYSLAEFSYQ
ncbi:MAG: M15 family metallopeptidase [Candidatus Paceibacterota bacterium]|jgi:D-alanyl-D-alanine dipeptidase